MLAVLLKVVLHERAGSLAAARGVAAVVRREAEKARKEAEAKAAAEHKANNTNVTANNNTTTSTNKAAAKPKSYLNLNAKDIALNTSFEKNKGILPWPVDNGVVTIPFGTGS